MTKEDLELIKYYQKWRREDGHFGTMPNPTEVGKALDKLIDYCELCLKLNENEDI